MAGVAFFDIDSFQLEEGVVATEYERPAPAPDYPIEIHSLNDFDVVNSVGKKNIHKGTSDEWREIYRPEGNLFFEQSTDIKLELGETYTFSIIVEKVSDDTVPINLHFGIGNNNFSWDRGHWGNIHNIPMGEKITRTFTVSEEDLSRGYETFAWRLRNERRETTIRFKEVKLEKSEYATSWVPHLSDIVESDNHPLIDKINLLLSEPLRSVGDVKDRLFRDSDGLWKIERNVGELVADGSESWKNSPADWQQTNTMSFSIQLGRGYVWGTFPKEELASNLFKSFYDRHEYIPTANRDFELVSADNIHGNKRFKVLRNRLKTQDLNGWREFLAEKSSEGNPLKLLYVVSVPTIEILNQSLQDKLNNLKSFQDSDYVYTIINDKTDSISENLKPTLHATFKSSGWYNRWKTADELRKHQAEIDDKADNKSTEESINNAIANIQVLQQELEAAATANELDDFIDRYNKDMAARNKDASQSEENLSTALSSISTIEKDLGEMSETWTFIDRFIKNTPEGIVVGNDTTGSYILIKEDRLSFYSNNQEVAFISQNLMEISRGAFVEEIQIAKYKFEESTDNHLTIRYAG